MKVLIVDDDRDVLKMAARYLEGRGLEVLTADSPFGVTPLVTRERPAVVVLDVMMPALDGEAVGRFLVALPEADRPAVLFYSAMPEPDLRALVKRVPGTRYVPKTAGLEALHDAVTRGARTGSES